MENIDFNVMGSLHDWIDGETNGENVTNERKSCDIYSKIFKNNTNLMRHISKYHSNSTHHIDETAFQNEIIMVVKKCVEGVKDDQCLDDVTL